MSEYVNQIHTGDAAEVLGNFPESSIHMCMTSPPYWNLRDYGVDGQLGLEKTPEDYVDNVANVLDQVRRVLRPDGSLWLNLGDTYDDKDLQQIPARVAMELRSRGWTLRNRVTWVKPNPMPQSVKDRLNDTTEAIYHLTPSKRYWYDLDEIREPHAESTQNRMGKGYKNATSGSRTKEDTPGDHHRGGGCHEPGIGFDDTLHSAGKNPGDVFEVITKPFPDAHFAVYPPELCEKPIKASCPPKVCPTCGTPYDRDVERETAYDHETTEKTGLDADRNDTGGGDGHDLRNGVYSTATFNGWEQACECDTDNTDAGAVLDPFAGAGTTLLKAKELGRKFVGIELNPEYADMARARCGLAPRNPEHIRGDDSQEGLESYMEGA